MSSTNNHTKSKRRPSAKAVAGVTLAALLALGTFAGPASARWADRGDRRSDNRNQSWTGGYYPAPPVVYAAPYAGGYGYYPPPVVYAPGIGINLGAVSIGIR